MNYFASIKVATHCWMLGQIASIELYSEESISKPVYRSTIKPNHLALPEVGRVVTEPWWTDESVDECEALTDLSELLHEGDSIYIWDPSNVIIPTLRHTVIKRLGVEHSLLSATQHCNLYNIYVAAYCLKHDQFSWPESGNDLQTPKRVDLFLKANNKPCTSNRGENIFALYSLFYEKSPQLLKYYLGLCSPGGSVDKLSLDGIGNIIDHPSVIAFTSVDSSGLTSVLTGLPIGTSTEGSVVFVMDMNKQIDHLKDLSSDEICEVVCEGLNGAGHILPIYRINLHSVPLIAPLSVVDKGACKRFAINKDLVKSNFEYLQKNTSLHSKLRDGANTEDSDIESHFGPVILHKEYTELLGSTDTPDIESLFASNKKSERWFAMLSMGSSATQSAGKTDDLQAFIKSTYLKPFPLGVSWDDFKESSKALNSQGAHNIYKEYFSFLKSIN